jgi:hypothetical protein
MLSPIGTQEVLKKHAVYHKYNPLEDWFRAQSAGTRQLTLTFGDIEKIIGEKLPKSAQKLKTWWTNLPPEGCSPRNSWLRTGWEVETADQVKEIVAFRRKS